MSKIILYKKEKAKAIMASPLLWYNRASCDVIFDNARRK